MESSKVKKPFWGKWRILIAVLAVVLVLSILGAVFSDYLIAQPTVYALGGADLHEDVYRYWFACFKYVYQVRYKELGIEDTREGWSKTGQDGRTYEEAFFEVMDDEIRLRFVAATLFDNQGYRLSDADYDELNTLIDEFSEEQYGDVAFDILKKTYGVTKNAVKETALYEKKYVSFYERLFSDANAIYAAEYRGALEAFYEKYFYRYNMIYVEDSLGESHISTLEAALWPNGNTGVSCVSGVTEETFTQLERDYTLGDGVTSGNYPNGIYLYAGESYTNAFTSELLSAFRAADEVGKVVKKRNAADNGTYYVMRYALDKEPYLSEDAKVKACFSKLPTYAGLTLYRDMLRKEAALLSDLGVAKTYTVAGTVACRDYNTVYLLGN